MKQLEAIRMASLDIAGTTFLCAVADDGDQIYRIISETGIMHALGSRSGASKRQKAKSLEKIDGGAPLPIFLAPIQLKPFYDKEFSEGPPKIVEVKFNKGVWRGFFAEVLPKVCKVWVAANAKGVLDPNQAAKAANAAMLLGGLAEVGIAALVDEATGFQDIRERYALQKILDKYLLKEYAKWAKRFPEEFYQEMFRLKNWTWKGMKVNRPSVVGHYTNDVVWSRLAPGLLEELKKRNPVNETTKRRKHRHHQLLTDEVGHPALAQHLHTLLAFMRASGNWGQFHRAVERAFPKLNETIPLALED